MWPEWDCRVPLAVQLLTSNWPWLITAGSLRGHEPADCGARQQVAAAVSAAAVPQGLVSTLLNAQASLSFKDSLALAAAARGREQAGCHVAGSGWRHRLELGMLYGPGEHAAQAAASRRHQ